MIDLMEQIRETSFLLEVEALTKTFTIYHLNQTLKGVENIQFAVKQGDFLGIVGPSGSGKSTIIKCIYRTYLPTQGRILYQSPTYGQIDLAQADERRIMALRKHEMAYASQFLDIIPRTSSFDMVRNALLDMGVAGDEAKDRAAAALRHFDIQESLWHQYPRTFSGGEKLRLNLATTMVKGPTLLLLDEPTASLDDGSKEKVKEAIIKMQATGTTLIGIFHDLTFMEGLVTDTYRMEKKA